MSWMLAPLVMCLVLTGIHGYLGLHVLSRKVIFVDLALAQIAALGTTAAFLLGWDPGARAAYWFSLGFTIAGAAVFALARVRSERVPQEALIGIVYATASAVAVLLLARAPGEGEHIKQMLVGNILLVTWEQVGKTALIYALVGGVHVALQRVFWEISQDAEAAQARGRRVRLWDFIFYATFGVVITSSVAIAGVLLVFSYLVVPATIAMLLVDTARRRIVGAWGVGTVASAAGIWLSYQRDLPTGPSVAACFAGLLLTVGLVRYVWCAERRGLALVHVVLGGALVAGLCVGATRFCKPQEDHTPEQAVERLLAAVESTDDNVAIDAIHHLEESQNTHAVPLFIERLQTTESDRLLEHLITALGLFGDARAVPALEKLSSREIDPDLRIEVARALLQLRAPSGFQALLLALEGDTTGLADLSASRLLREMTGNDFGLGAARNTANRAKAVERFQQWWKTAGASVKWRAERRRFE